MADDYFLTFKSEGNLEKVPIVWMSEYKCSIMCMENRCVQDYILYEWKKWKKGTYGIWFMLLILTDIYINIVYD